MKDSSAWRNEACRVLPKILQPFAIVYVQIESEGYFRLQLHKSRSVFCDFLLLLFVFCGRFNHKCIVLYGYLHLMSDKHNSQIIVMADDYA